MGRSETALTDNRGCRVAKGRGQRGARHRL